MLNDKSLLVQRMFFACFWILAYWGFLAELIMGNDFLSVYFASFLLTDTLLLVMCALTIKHKFDFFIIGSYTVLSFVSTCIVNDIPVPMWINGSRTFFGVLFVVPVLRYFWDDPARHDRFTKGMKKQMYIFLWVQTLCATMQFLQYGAGDMVGGSMGTTGYSGVLSFLIYAFSFILIRSRLDVSHFWRSIGENWVYIFLLFPSFLNETKVSFILILLYFALLFPLDKQFFKRILIGIPIGVAMMALVVVAYISVNKQTQGTDIGNADFLTEYLIGDFDDVEEMEGRADYAQKLEDSSFDIPRFAKLALIPIIEEQNEGHWMSGFGVGIYKGGREMENTPFAEEYDWYIQGTSPYIMHMILQLGILGTLWFIVFFFSLFFRKPKLFPLPDRNVHLYFLAIFFIMLFYADLWKESMFCIGIFTFMFLSWKPSYGKIAESQDSTEQVLLHEKIIT